MQRLLSGSRPSPLKWIVTQSDERLWRRFKNRRAHADHFDWPDKGLKEWGIAQTFKEELERDCADEIESSQQHPGGKNDPPDYRLTMKSGETWGVEITELVDQKAVKKTKRAGESVFPVWSDEQLVAKFRKFVSRKDGARNVGGGLYDQYVLLVHVDEPDLEAARLSKLLGVMTFKMRLIDRIYVLVSYDPRTQRYPLLKLAVEKQRNVLQG